MIEITPAQIDGVRIVRPMVHSDARGTFVKTVHADIFARHGLPTHFAEQYYSVSSHNVLRGLHLQTPPYHHDKLVSCLEGEIFDVVVDLRRGHDYGRHQGFELDGAKGDSLFVPAGCAHGFYVRSPTAIVLYNAGTVHTPQHDTGIRWNSAGIAWPSTSPIVSDRDAALVPLAAFNSPFGSVA